MFERVTMAQPLPSGLSPVHAGRIGLWLLGVRQHNAAERRVAFPPVRHTTLVWRFTRLTVRWKIIEYPGMARFLSAVLGIAPSYARNLLKPSATLPAKHARKLAAYLSNHASACEALAAEMRDYASQIERSKIYDKSALRRRRDMR